MKSKLTRIYFDNEEEEKEFYKWVNKQSNSKVENLKRAITDSMERDLHSSKNNNIGKEDAATVVYVPVKRSDIDAIKVSMQTNHIRVGRDLERLYGAKFKRAVKTIAKKIPSQVVLVRGEKNDRL